MNLTTRRAFLGTALATPLAAPFLVGSHAAGHLGGEPAAMPHLEQPAKTETEVALQFDNGADRLLTMLTPERMARVVFTLLTAKLRDLPCRLVGPEQAHVGTLWGSGHFTKRVYALIPDFRLAYDRVFLNDLATALAGQIRREGLMRFGRLQVPSGLDVALLRENTRIALRFVRWYDFTRDTMTGVFDVLGGPAV